MSERQPRGARTPSGGESTPVVTEHFLLHLADRLGAKATVSVVYGEPIERDGVTVIPVARVRWGFGGGGGSGNGQAEPGSNSGGGNVSSQAEPGSNSGGGNVSSQAGPGSGLGGGANISVTPVGYIEIANGMTEFRRISE